MDNKKTILAVDDNSINLVMLQAILGVYYNVTTAHNAAETEKSAVENKPDLILLDVELPDKDGFEVCKALKNGEHTKNIPVIFITGRNDTDSIAYGLSSGGADYICKPFASEELLNRIRIHLSFAEQQNALEKRLKEEIEKNKELEVRMKVMPLFNNGISDAVTVCDMTGKTVYSSKSCNKIFATDTDTDFNFFSAAETEDDKKVLKSFFESLTKNQHGTLRYVLHRQKDVRKVVLETVGYVWEQAGEKFVVLNTKNITETAKSQAKLRQNIEFQKKLRLVSQNVNKVRSFTESCAYLVDALTELIRADEIILLLGKKDKSAEFFYRGRLDKNCRRGNLPPTQNDYGSFTELLKKSSGSLVCNIQSPYIPEVVSARSSRYVLFPLIVERMLAGVIYVGKMASGGISQENVYAVATVASLVKNAVRKKVYEKRIIRQEKEISNLFKYSANGIITINKNTEILRYNRRFLELFGIRTNSDLTGRQIASVVKGGAEKDLEDLIGKVGKPPLFETISVTAQDIDGKDVFMEATASKIKMPDDEITLIVFTDVTGLRNMDSAIIRATSAAEEKERTRLARELHDGLGAQLSSINIYVNLILSGGVNAGEIYSTLKLVKTIVSQAVTSVKEIADNLHPVILSRFGLVDTVNNIIEGLENSRLIKFGFTHSLFQPITDKNLELSVYRIINELINNTMKHSSAKNIAISLLTEDNRLILEYADDGKGVDMKALSRSKGESGHGISNIRARVKAAGGKCRICTKPQKGFRVLIEIPV